jgi:cobalamin biosynthesis protein CbiD
LLGGKRALTDIWGSGPDSVWIVGEAGSILRWNGSAFELESSAPSEDLKAVWGHASGVVWAVGSNETLLRRQF